MEYPDDALVLDTWVQNLFPLVEDNESRVSEKALEVRNFHHHPVIGNPVVIFFDLRTTGGFEE